MLLVPLSDPAGVGGCHCLPHPERLIANQEYLRPSMQILKEERVEVEKLSPVNDSDILEDDISNLSESKYE